jgi:cytochrome c5
MGPPYRPGHGRAVQASIEGYTGEKGMMPAKGGNPSLSDENTKAAVDYMVDLSK